MPQNDLMENGRLVDQMRYTILEGEINVKHIPNLVKEVIKTEAWKKRYLCGRPVSHESFLSFIETAPLAGMGWSSAEDKQQVRDLLRLDPEAQELWDKAIRGERNQAINAKDEANPSRQGQRTDIVSNAENVAHKVRRPTTGSAARAMRKLRADAPAIHARVLTGELTPHGGMIEAGFRKPRPKREKLSPYEQIMQLLPKLTAAERRAVHLKTKTATGKRRERAPAMKNAPRRRRAASRDGLEALDNAMKICPRPANEAETKWTPRKVRERPAPKAKRR